LIRYSCPRTPCRVPTLHAECGRPRCQRDRYLAYNTSLLILSSHKQFAIRPTIRNHTTLNRDIVIKQVADAVGKPHSVDLKGYDLLILVEIYKVRLTMHMSMKEKSKIEVKTALSRRRKRTDPSVCLAAVGKPECNDYLASWTPQANKFSQNICGMSVVGHDYDTLKRYNLSEIYSPTPKPDRD
jgi:hypothetical protein